MAFCQNSVQIDDFNDNIVYSGPWESFTDQPYGFNGTRHVATAPGLSANFKFNGSCLFVNGIVGTNGSLPMPPATFVLDGHFTQMNGSVVDGDPFPGTDFAQAVFYIAFTISEGEHELIITNLGGNASTPFMLDGFIITPLQNATTSSGTSSSTTSSSSMPTSSSATSTTSFASASPTAAVLASSPSHTGAIVGGVVGGVGGFLVLALVAFFAWRYFVKKRGDLAPGHDIRPFAAWRGDGQPVLPTVGAGAGMAKGNNDSKLPIPPSNPMPGGAPDASASGSTSSEVAGPAVIPGPSGHFPGDSKVQPPGYTP